MRFSTILIGGILAAATATPAMAQDTAPPEPITISGSATLVTDYRYRGVSQTDKEMAFQAGLTVSHESGVYAGFWGSNLAGWGTFGGSNTELDLLGGVVVPVGGGGNLDLGLTWIMYPGGADTTDFAELHAKLSGEIGPISLAANVSYAPPQKALGKVYYTGAAAAAGTPDDPGDKEDNLYLSGDGAYAIMNTPVTLDAHIGYSDGNSGLGPNGTSIAPTGTYFDWSLGGSVVYKSLTLGVHYIDTDISKSDAAYLLPNFSKGGTTPIADATVVFSIGASF
ncbi:MAG: hypothetical protein CMN72_11325 [Sphingomonas sp.]|nr:hypothetical protein [Sphingomonas sp.]